MDFASPQKVMSQNAQLAQYGDDTSLYVEFSTEPVHLVFLSEKEGRAIYEDREFISIQAPGQNKTKSVREVRDEDRFRFPRQYAAFKSSAEQNSVGMPLGEWGTLTKAQVLEFKAMHIHTVEQLAALPDSSLSWMGAREMRNKASEYLKKFDKNEVENLKKSVEALKEQNEKLLSLLSKNEELSDEETKDSSLPETKVKRKYTKKGVDNGI